MFLVLFVCVLLKEKKIFFNGNIPLKLSKKSLESLRHTCSSKLAGGGGGGQLEEGECVCVCSLLLGNPNFEEPL